MSTVCGVKVFPFVLLLCPLLSAASCDGKANSCFPGEDETSLIQTKKSVELGIERPAKGKTRKDVFEEMNDPTAVSLVESEQVPDLTIDNPHMGHVASQIVNEGVQGYMPTLSSLPKRMTTVNLALMALGVPGDFVETGVYYGGTSVLMAKVLQKFDDQRERTMWSADSFIGLPTEDGDEYHRELKGVAPPVDGRVANRYGHPGDYAAPRDTFEENLKANGLRNKSTSPTIKVLQGWFNETLPDAPIEKIAFLRLDGDIYVSTHDSLNALYDRVVPGGFIYIDDYGTYIGCKHAVDEFRQQRGIKDIMYPVFEVLGSVGYDASWWRKSH